MYRVNHSFLFRGKRYKVDQLVPDDHTIVKYRTQFIEPVVGVEVGTLESVSTIPPEIVETPISVEVIPEVKPKIQLPLAQVKPQMKPVVKPIIKPININKTRQV